jgi:hypothetical protein
MARIILAAVDVVAEDRRPVYYSVIIMTVALTARLHRFSQTNYFGFIFPYYH